MHISFSSQRCDGCRHCSPHSTGRPSDDQGCLVHRRHRGRSVHRGHVCSQWKVPQHGWPIGCGLWRGLCLLTWLVFYNLTSFWDQLTTCVCSCINGFNLSALQLTVNLSVCVRINVPAAHLCLWRRLVLCRHLRRPGAVQHVPPLWHTEGDQEGRDTPTVRRTEIWSHKCVSCLWNFSFTLLSLSFLVRCAHKAWHMSHSLSFSRCMGIYMDTLNIFMRLVMILANGGGGRRKWMASVWLKLRAFRLPLQTAQQKHVLWLAALVRRHPLVTSLIQLLNKHVLCGWAGKRFALGNAKAALIVEAPLVGDLSASFPSYVLRSLYVFYLFTLSDVSFDIRLKKMIKRNTQLTAEKSTINLQTGLKKKN